MKSGNKNRWSNGNHYQRTTGNMQHMRQLPVATITASAILVATLPVFHLLLQLFVFFFIFYLLFLYVFV